MPESREWSAICNLKDTTTTKSSPSFYLSDALFEIPCNLPCKHGWFLPIATVLFGVASLATAYVNNYAQMLGVRFLLGIFGAGVLPGDAYYLSR